MADTEAALMSVCVVQHNGEPLRELISISVGAASELAAAAVELPDLMRMIEPDWLSQTMDGYTVTLRTAGHPGRDLQWEHEPGDRGPAVRFVEGILRLAVTSDDEALSTHLERIAAMWGTTSSGRRPRDPRGPGRSAMKRRANRFSR